MYYKKPSQPPISAYIRQAFPMKNSEPLGSSGNETSGLGFEGLITFSSGTAASGVSLNYTHATNYIPYRGVNPHVELQNFEAGKSMEIAPELRKK